MKNNLRIWAALALALIIIPLAGCEQKAWQQARAKKTIEGYQEYLRKYPDGKYANKAWKGIDALSFLEAYKAKTPQAYHKYLRQFPNGDKVDKAKLNIQKLYRAKSDKLSVEEMAAARVTVETSLGSFTISLDPARAPNTCRNLLYLAWIEFYNGLTVTPVVAGRLVQMGDPLGNGFGGPGYMIPAEINDNKLSREAVAMWRLPVDPNTAGSQFFICLSDQSDLDGQFTVFGHVVSGMDVLDKIGKVETSGPQGQPPWKPLQTIYMNKVTVSGITLNWSRVQVNQEGPENEEPGEEQE